MEKFKSIIKKNPIQAVIIVSLIFIVSVIIITVLNLTPKSEIEVLVAPSSATVTINNKTYKNGTYKLDAGTYHVKIEKDGFTPKEYDFDFNDKSKLYDYLMPSDGNLNWYLEHQDDAIILTKIGDFEATLLSDASSIKYPILEKLPLIVSEYDNDGNYLEFRIDGGADKDCEHDFCLKVTDSTGGNLTYAKEKILELGFDPNDYQILYEYTPIIPLE